MILLDQVHKTKAWFSKHPGPLLYLSLAIYICLNLHVLHTLEKYFLYINRYCRLPFIYANTQKTGQ